MKSFIKKISLFLLLSIVVLATIVLGSKYIVKSKSSFKINEDITKLIIGHSHSECSVDDSLLDNSINLSASGESYFYNYQKLKKVLEENKQINSVFIEFSNSQIDSVMDDWIWGFEKMSYYLQYYSPFLSSEDFNLLFENNSTDLISSYSIATRKHLYRIINGDYYLTDEIGSYADSRLSKINELMAKNRFNSTISKSQSLSTTNLTYLRKMIDLCRENKVEVFLLRSPQHPLYADLINEPVFQNVLKSQFSDVDLLDFNDMSFPNSYYLDFHHVNYKGAQQFTRLLNELINTDLLSFSNKQELIDKSLEHFNSSNL
ncbi:hypothetical protein FJ651_09735 [Paucihalobacter ruber]|uniref:Uncharacterized protein n=1 Tax=Paucihalobacter ruber TaxID=2567861 RepID=A0A506PHQ7_9FLAO|nr:hypothetical protein [Paucihalobacter ruber]TPV33363.1 hypothetical protein FJ651_09735 [Paucihalobacter ruber]